MTKMQNQNRSRPTAEERMLQARLIEACELQFLLASAVRIATMNGSQPLDLPQIWSHGKHTVAYDEIVLTMELADEAACYLERAATYMMAVQIKDAMKAIYQVEENEDQNSNVRAAYQIARMIRNSFTHHLLRPVWSIDKDCRNKIFEIPDIIRLDTTNLNGKVFDWRAYGGPLAILHLSRFVRRQLLNCPDRYSITGSGGQNSKPNSEIYQQGNLLLLRVDEIPDGARQLNIEPLPDSGIPLGDGHVLRPESDE